MISSPYVFDRAVHELASRGTLITRVYLGDLPEPAADRVTGVGISDVSKRVALMREVLVTRHSREIGGSLAATYVTFYDGGRRSRSLEADGRWSAWRDQRDDPRQRWDPNWIVDALLGATPLDGSASAEGVAPRPVSAVLDLTLASNRSRFGVDGGQRRMDILFDRQQRQWLRAVPARVMLDETGRLVWAAYQTRSRALGKGERLWRLTEWAPTDVPVRLDVPNPGDPLPNITEG